MSIRCPRCGAEYDVTLFSFGGTVGCDCGARVDASSPHVARPLLATPPTVREDPASFELRRRADAITWTLLYTRVPRVDVDIAIEDLRAWVARVFPDRQALFEMIYVARWRRLTEQGWTKDRPDV